MDTNDALVNLLRSLKDDLQIVKENGASDLKFGDLSGAEQAIQRARLLEKWIDQLTEMYSLWGDIMPWRRPAEGSTSLPPPIQTTSDQLLTPLPGERRKTPESEYYIPLLQALVEMGGHGMTAAVVDRVGELMERVLNDYDREMLPGGTDIRWRNTAQWARNELVHRGLMRQNMPRGIWEISEEGKKFLEKELLRREYKEY